MTPAEIIKEAIVAANAAGDKWMANVTTKFEVRDGSRIVGSLLDYCGNAHIEFKDKRTKNYKQFKAAGFVPSTYSAVIEIAHRYKNRQEYGLAMECSNAARDVLVKHGITDVKIWSYFD